jgi:precorrin-2 dehydrogenase / sirohydrochlorin ferrochelatase
MKNNLFPIFINLEARQCLVIGGGSVGERKAADLLACGARVKVISPQASNKLAERADMGVIIWMRRKFTADDLKGAFLVFIATGDRYLNQQVVTLCRQQAILVNAVDDPPHCDFYVPAVLRRKSLAVAISTGGNSPLLAKRLRQELEQIITEAYGDLAEILGDQRAVIQDRIPDINERKKVLASLVDSDLLELLEAGGKEKARGRSKKSMSCLQD